MTGSDAALIGLVGAVLGTLITHGFAFLKARMAVDARATDAREVRDQDAESAARATLVALLQDERGLVATERRALQDERTALQNERAGHLDTKARLAELERRMAAEEASCERKIADAVNAVRIELGLPQTVRPPHP